MKRHIFTAIFLLIGYLLQAQTLEWDKAIPSINNQMCYTIDTVGNNYWLGGYFSNPHEHLLLYAINSSGDTLWHKNYLPNAILSGIYKILPAPAGKYIIGIYSDDTIPQQTQNATPFIFYVDYSGEIIWEQHNLIPECASFGIKDVKLMANGDIVIVGMYDRLYDYCVAPPYTAAAMRISPEGDKIWEHLYPQSYIYSIERLQELPNNELLYSGYSWNNNINFTFLMKVNGENGDVIQSKYVYPTTSPNGASMYYGTSTGLSDGGYLVTGWYMYNNVPYGYLSKLNNEMNQVWSKKLKNISFDKPYEMLDRSILMKTNSSKGLLFVRKYTAQGDSVWKVTFGEPLTFSETNSPISGVEYRLEDGFVKGTSFIIAGYKANYNAYTGGDFFAAKINDVGLPLNNFCQHAPQAEINGAFSNDTLKLKSNSFANIFYYPSLTYAWYAGGSYIGSDSLLSLQVNPANYPNGLPIKLVITNHWGCKDSTQAILHPDGSITGSKPNTQQGKSAITNIYPNPASGFVRLDYDLPMSTKDAYLKIYEIGTGRVLLQKRLSVMERSTRLDMSQLPAGLYTVQLYADGLPSIPQKISVVR